MTTPIPLFKLSWHPWCVKMVHCTEVLLHVDTGSKGCCLPDHDPDFYPIHGLGNFLPFLFRGFSGYECNLIPGDTSSNQFFNQIVCSVKSFMGGGGFYPVVISGSLGNITETLFHKHDLSWFIMLKVMFHDIFSSPVDLISGMIWKGPVIKPCIKTSFCRISFNDNRISSVSRQHYFSALLSTCPPEWKSTFHDIPQDFFLIGRHFGDFIDNFFIWSPDNLPIAYPSVQQFCFVCIGQVFVFQGFAFFGWPGLEFRHVICENGIHILACKPPQFRDIIKFRQPGYGLIVTRCGHFNIGFNPCKRVKPGIPA